MPSVTDIRNAGIKGKASTGNVDAPTVQLAGGYAYQSYFDSTLLEKALLAQAQGEQIVASTKQASSLAGYALGLHPSSQCPIAVSFKKGAQAGDSTVQILKPGQIIRPNGLNGVEVDKDGRFSGFEFGLPFGWLGGGSYTLVVFRTADAKVDWRDRSELIFHRQRVQIVSPANVPAPASLRFNWPTRFPWPKALRRIGTADIPQKGTAVLAVNPTRVVMSLSADLAASATMRMYFVGSDEFDSSAFEAAPLTNDPVAYDVTWGMWASVASANFATQKQFQFLPPEAFKLSANVGAVVLVDVTGTLAGLYVDVVRYGVL